MFGDMHWQSRMVRAQQARLSHWLKKTRRVLVIELGAGMNISTVRHFSEGVGMPLIRINSDGAGVG